MIVIPNKFQALHPVQRSRNLGFSLIELMITIGILAIIISVAIPSYTRWVIEANRAEGKAFTMKTAQTLERCFTRFSSYNDANCSLGNGDTVDSESAKYTVTVTTASNTFSLSAAPARADPECGNLLLNHRGVRGVSGSGSVEDCW